MQKLSKDAYRLLKKLYDVSRMEETELFLFVGHTDTNKIEPISHLLVQEKMIKVYNVGGVPDGDGGYTGAKRIYEIDLLGKAYVESQKEADHNKKIENARYFITTAISVIALIKSFFPEILSILGQISPQS